MPTAKPCSDVLETCEMAGGDTTAETMKHTRPALAEDIKAFVEDVVATAPPLTLEQLDKLALLLRPSS